VGKVAECLSIAMISHKALVYRAPARVIMLTRQSQRQTVTIAALISLLLQCSRLILSYTFKYIVVHDCVVGGNGDSRFQTCFQS